MFALTTGLIDMFPGPTIEARSGDTLLITVTNAVEEESIALHWHGIHVTSMCLIPLLDGNPLIIEPRQLTPARCHGWRRGCFTMPHCAWRAIHL